MDCTRIKFLLLILICCYFSLKKKNKKLFQAITYTRIVRFVYSYCDIQSRFNPLCSIKLLIFTPHDLEFTYAAKFSVNHAASLLLRCKAESCATYVNSKAFKCKYNLSKLRLQSKLGCFGW